jgi:predicted MPP superfamily phosphohydrolase
VLCDFVGFVVNKIRKCERRKNYINGFIALAITVIYLGCGWFFAHHVFRTDCTMQTTKNIGTESLRIVEIADLHLGITLDGDDFAEQCKRVNETNPDVVVVCGDFVDDDSKCADMIKACNALGTLQTKYGVYWIYGNHDRSYYNYRDFTTDELVKNLEKNNVKVLTDESVLIEDTFYIIGRDDRSVESRMSAKQLTKGLDKSKYIIMLDHQPNDYDNEVQSGADLVLSGHTHGGHIFPAGIIGTLTKSNNMVYGTEKLDTTDFTVSSGISGWAIPFKTFCISEFVVIDVEQNSKQ